MTTDRELRLDLSRNGNGTPVKILTEADVRRIAEEVVRAELKKPAEPEMIEKLAAQKREAETAKDIAYEERNRLVAVLASLYPSVRTKTAIEGWSEDWHGCVYINSPVGQLSWHYHDSQARFFAHIPEGAAVWDGHTTEEKYHRIEKLYTSPRGAAADLVTLCNDERREE